ncbi:MAG: TolC family protein [bacterium]
MIKKLCCFLWLIFFLAALSLSGSPGFTVRAEEFSVSEAVDYALENNQEISLDYRAYQLEKKKEESNQRSLNLSLDSHSGLEKFSRQQEISAASDITANLQQELLGGTLSGTWKTGINVMEREKLTSDLSLNYKREFFTENKSELNNNSSQLENSKNELRKKVMTSYLLILEKQKELQLREEELKIKKEKLDYRQKKEADLELIENAEEQIEIVREEKQLTAERLDEELNKFKKLLNLPPEKEVELTQNVEYIKEIKGLDYWQKEALLNKDTYQDGKQELKELKNQVNTLWDNSDWNFDFEMGLRPYQIYPGPADSSADYYVQFEVSKEFQFLFPVQREEKKLAQERKELENNKEKERILNQVEATYREIIDNRKKIVNLQEDYLEAKEDFAGLKKEYDSGLIGSIELKEGKLELSELEQKIFSQKSDIILDFINLQQICGLKLKWPQKVRDEDE